MIKKLFVLGSMLVLLFCAGCGKEEIPEEMDLSLAVEIAQTQDVLDALLATSREDVIYDDPQTVGEPYIPEGSLCIDISASETVVYIDYRLNDIRYIVSYYSDGTIEKNVREMDGNKIYTVWSNKEGVEITDL